MAKTTFIAAGDAFATKRLPKGGYEGFDEIQACVKAHDVAFLNLESTFHDREGIPAAISGGTWAMSDPRILDDMKEYGFNLFNTANNHSCDYSQSGVLATIKHLQDRDMIFAGTGKDLGDASKACYIETKHARVAMLACNSSGNDSARAGAQTEDLPGRPGANPMRCLKRFHVDQKHFDMVKELAEVTMINASAERSIELGYSAPYPEGQFPFGGSRFILDDHNWVETVPHKGDMERMIARIKEAKKQADIVLVSIHSHYYDERQTNIPSRFIETFARNCIDAGADVIIGHGPHELQGIEKYKDGLIFYSIGNYIFETETVEYQPWDAYVNKGYSPDMKVGEYMDLRSKNGTAGYGVLPEIWNSVMAAWTVEDGKITEVQLYPVTLNMEKTRSQKGRPVMNKSEETLKYLAELSQPYGTKIEIKDGVGYIRF
ncbi:MAG: CapA family protein [Oscillospiraceae bacterium]|nr:CapA family protein [Oscillospiraceae bacterium]